MGVAVSYERGTPVQGLLENQVPPQERPRDSPGTCVLGLYTLYFKIAAALHLAAIVPGENTCTPLEKRSQEEMVKICNTVCPFLSNAITFAVLAC